MDIDMPQPTVAKELVLEVGPEFELFANDLDDCLSPLLSVAEKRDKILDLPRKYHENALKRLAKLEPRTTRSQNDDASTYAGGELASLRESDPVRQLEREAQTWDLLRRLLPLRHQASKTQNNRSRLENLADKPTTTNALHEFLDTNPDAKERRAVLQWLQTNAASGPEIDELTEKLQKNADRGDIIAHGWLHTRSAIKNRKRLTGWPHLLDRQSANASSSLLTESGAPLVTQLDPDACTRQGRKLQPQDEYFERAIWLGCFEHLRRGSDLQTLREWCEERTEMWRAVSLSAMLLSGDEDGVSGVVDPMALTLWRRMCFGLARQGGSDDYERAVYGVLSGDIQSVEKVASTWDDHLFAHYNALLRTQIDHFLLKECTQDVASSLTTTFPTFDAIQFHGEQGGAEKRLLKSLESQPSTKQEALLPHKALQAAVISKEVQEYLFDQGLALGPQTGTMPLLFGNATISSDRSARVFKPDELDGLRIVAHVFALVSVLERLASEEQGHTNSSSINFEPRQRTTQENIIAQYTDLLRRAKLPELVPLYCSLLDTPRLYEVLSSNLILEQQLENRLTQLKLIKRANINVVEFVQAQASMLYDRVAKDSISPKIEGSFGFHILEDGPPSTRLGRTIKADFFGEDENDVEPAHDHLIRSLEWLLLVDETWADVFAAGTRIYKYFLRKHSGSCEPIAYCKVAKVRFRKHASPSCATAHEESTAI
jgi:nuclear pore complex protein Nup107